MGSMIEDKGPEYVAAWPKNIANRARCSTVYVIGALNAVTGSNLADSVAYSTEPIPEVAALTPEQAKAVAAHVFATMNAIADRQASHCYYCGAPLDGGVSRDGFGERACSGCS